MPELPELEFALVPPAHRFVSKKLQECNWAQAVRGRPRHRALLVPAHAGRASHRTSDAILRRSSADLRPVAWMKDDPQPGFDVERPRRRPRSSAPPGGPTATTCYWRITQFLLPNHGLAPNAFAGETYNGQTWVPIDDVTSWVYCYTLEPRPAPDRGRA